MDSIFLYNEFHEENVEQELLLWKSSNVFEGIVFKCTGPTMQIEDLHDSSRTSAKNAEDLYFINQGIIADSMPAFKVNFSHEYGINIRSYQEEHRRNFKLTSSHIFFLQKHIVVCWQNMIRHVRGKLQK